MADPGVRDPGPDDAAALAAAVLEAEIRRTEAAVVPEVVLADSELPGVGEDAMSLREALRLGGARTITILGLLGALQVMDGGVFNVLAPDIQKSLDVSDAVLGAIGGATGVLFVARRDPDVVALGPLVAEALVAITMSFWSVIIALTGAVQNAFQMFLARLGSGLGQSASAARERAPARRHLSDPVAGAGLRDARRRAGGRDDGGTVPRRRDRGARGRRQRLAVGVLAPRCRRASRSRCPPTRSRNRGGAGTRCSRCSARSSRPKSDELPISLSVAFERLRQIRSFYYFLVGMAALGFALFTAPLFLNLYFDEELGLDAFQRGIVATVVAIPTFIAIAIVGPARRCAVPSQPARRDGVRRPARRARSASGWSSRSGMPNIWAVVPVLAVVDGLRTRRVRDPSRGRLDDHPLPAAGARHGDDRDLRVPVRRRSSARCSPGCCRDAFGTRTALVIIVLPSTLIGGALIALGARHIRRRHGDGRRGAPRGAAKNASACSSPTRSCR